jgi:hypothetical protein
MNGKESVWWSENFFFVFSSLGQIVLGLVANFRQLTLTILIFLYPDTKRY